MLGIPGRAPGRAVPGDDQVVEDVDVQQLACFNNRPGDMDILRAGAGIPAGVVVGNEDPGGVVNQGGLRKTSPHLRGVDTALVELDQVQELVAGIEVRHPQFFVIRLPRKQVRMA